MGEAAEDEIDRAIGGDWENDYDAEQDDDTTAVPPDVSLGNQSNAATGQVFTMPEEEEEKQ